MALTFFFVPAGTLAAFALIRYYDDHSGQLNHRDICTGLLWCALWLLLSVYSRKELSLPLSISMGLLCACTVTDALRTWLPAELTLPLAVSMLWHASLFPWGFQNALIWGAVWATFYGGRWLFYRMQRREDSPGGGDIILAGIAGIAGGPSSAFLIASAIAGHLAWGTVRHLHEAPFGPWLCLAITVQLLLF